MKEEKILIQDDSLYKKGSPLYFENKCFMFYLCYAAVCLTVMGVVLATGLNWFGCVNLQAWA